MIHTFVVRKHEHPGFAPALYLELTASGVNDKHAAPYQARYGVTGFNL